MTERDDEAMAPPELVALPVAEEQTAFDFGALTFDDAPEPTVPNHKASEDRKPIRGFRKPAGDRRETRKPPKERPRIPNRKGQFVEPLTTIYSYVGMALMPFDAVCANAVLMSAENCARSIDELAYKNDAVRRIVFSLTQTSAVGVVIMAHAPILMAVLMHHVPAAQNMLGAMGQNMADKIAEEMAKNTPNPEGPQE